VFVEDTSQHVILKSIDSLILFKDEFDYNAFTLILEELNNKHELDIHSYVLAPSFFEFLATPLHAEALSKFMQSLGRKYVGYFNKKYNRTGTLWDGRYKSSLVEDEVYLFDVMKYIETRVEKAHTFSSLRVNLLNESNSVVSKNKLYKQLGFTDIQRLEKYSKFFNSKIDEKKVQFIESSLEKQLVTGTSEFIKNLEALVGMRLTSKTRGRPKKQLQQKRKKMYKNLVVLDNEKHKELKISPLESLAFAKETTFVPLAANELTLVAASFPVVFTSDENPSLVALVSLGGENLAINAEGKWITQYVPSHFRKYPFALAGTKEKPEQKVILIDEESAAFSKSKGKQLFKKTGEHSDVLKHAIKFLTDNENSMILSKTVAQTIKDSGILEDREISVGEGDEKKVLVQGFQVVDREKLNALSDDVLADWTRRGFITMIDAHLKSLDNIQALFNIAHQRQS